MTVVAIPEVGKSLEHYGRKGMKWGQRIFTSGRSSSSSSSSLPPKVKTKAPVSEDYARASAARAKPSYALSNQEMQALITRIRLEKDYATLTAKPPRPVVQRKDPFPIRAAKGVGNFGKDLAIDIAKTETRRVSKKAGELYVNRALNKRGMDGFMGELGEALLPKQKGGKGKK